MNKGEKKREIIKKNYFDKDNEFILENIDLTNLIEYKNNIFYFFSESKKYYFYTKKNLNDFYCGDKIYFIFIYDENLIINEIKFYGRDSCIITRSFCNMICKEFYKNNDLKFVNNFKIFINFIYKKINKNKKDFINNIDLSSKGFFKMDFNFKKNIEEIKIFFEIKKNIQKELIV